LTCEAEAGDAPSRRAEAEPSDAEPSDAERRAGWPWRAVRVAAIYGAVAALVASKAPLCPMAKVVHQPCPGCGLTRATLELAHGDFAAAFALHPLSILISPLFVFVVLKLTKSYIWTGRMISKREPAWVYPAWGVLSLVMIALWAARFLGAFGGPVAIG